MKRAVFLDRDGVLNRSVERGGVSSPPAGLEEWQLLPGVEQACRVLHAAGFLLIVVTNQPDVARGATKKETVEQFHRLLRAQLPLDDVRVCYHDDVHRCACRKPAPGLLLQAASDWGIDLRQSFLVGDRWKDVEAGRRAGCRTVFVPGSKEVVPARCPSARSPSAPDHQAAGLPDAAVWILQQMPRARSAAPFPVLAFPQDAGQVSLPVLSGGSHMKSVSELRVKLFADGADRAGILEMYSNPLIRGFTTNPTLMRKAGISDYRAFAVEILDVICDRPISFEIFADDPEEMELQALEISSWAENVFVKIPVTNTRGQSTARLLRALARLQIKVNVTALTTLDQVQEVSECLSGGPPSVISVFAGRIADTGRDPVPLMAAAVELLRPSPNLQLLWASPRELLNIFQADAVGCHIITATNDILKKLSLVQKDLREYSLETVRMFYQDAQAAGYRLETSVAGVKQA